ncbi:YgfZ/GcvT domain-containing protein [Hirschia litorea]|uniref:YgfZ/GcvT domain-containing protein n=1 Tax=Hirschia litorea TaxID=1199156 RepID=A0ABW2IIN8_9PROT
MSEPVCLENRVVLCVDGADADTFLNGLLTNSMTGMAKGEMRYAALLMPQGKIISDLLALRTPVGFLLDVPAQADEALAKRLNMFKLKAKVDVRIRDDLAVYAFVKDGLIDPRNVNMPRRSIDKKDLWDNKSRRAYDIECIKNGVPEQGKDFGENEVFPADVNMDMLNGVDFKKGCFVGQEVVSRMKRRATARRRTLGFHFPAGAPDSHTPISIGGTNIGQITSSKSEYAFALVRIDRMAKAQNEHGDAFLANEREASLIEPEWLAEQIKAVTSSG